MSNKGLVLKKNISNLPSLPSLYSKIENKKVNVSAEIKEIRPRETQALLDEVKLRLKEGKL